MCFKMEHRIVFLDLQECDRSRDLVRPATRTARTLQVARQFLTSRSQEEARKAPSDGRIEKCCFHAAGDTAQSPGSIVGLRAQSARARIGINL